MKNPQNPLALTEMRKAKKLWLREFERQEDCKLMAESVWSGAERHLHDGEREEKMG